jgi:UDP-GlcNAc3NAcA epimerase
MMIGGLEEILAAEKPDSVILYGDTNSTVAGALAASKMHIPVIHIEAGLRSWNKNMPEEINRILCDHVSTLLFAPTETAKRNLIREGFDPEETNIPASVNHPKIYNSGDVMYDNSMYFATLAEKIKSMQGFDPCKQDFILATIHRDHNTDHPEKLTQIFEAFDKISRKNNITIVIPLHPRTSKLLKQNLPESLYDSVSNNLQVILLEPVSFLEMTALEMHATMIMTDSGGVQKESFFFKKPCIILRPETEWTELVEAGNAILADADCRKISDAYDRLKLNKDITFPPVFGDGKASEFICNEIYRNISIELSSRRKQHIDF